jgi:RNAse (barnase) inhibitor barstar
VSDDAVKGDHFGPGPVYMAPLSDAAAAAICALARSRGFDCARVDLSGCTEKSELLSRIAKALEFPAWFGHNWDALADCLTDLGWRPAAGYVLVIENAEEMQQAEPEVFDTALAILADAAAAWKARGATFRSFVSLQSRC